MTTLTIIIIYLIGVVLSLGRLAGSFYEIEERYTKWVPCSYKTILDTDMAIYSLFSWLCFLAGLIVYFGDKEKYFFKWSYKPLIKNGKNEKGVRCNRIFRDI